jgi:hypothetical protein
MKQEPPGWGGVKHDNFVAAKTYFKHFMSGYLRKSIVNAYFGENGKIWERYTMRKIMGNKPQVSSTIIIHSPLQISWNDLLHQSQTADVSINRAKTGTFYSIETLDVHLAP